MINDWHHMFGIRGQSATPTIPLIAHTFYLNTTTVNKHLSNNAETKAQFTMHAR